MKVPSVLKSYHLLTVFLWFMESKPTSFWEETQEENNFEANLKELFLFLCEHLDKNEIRHYFIKSLNLVENLVYDQGTENPLSAVSQHIKMLVKKSSFPR